MSLVTNLKGVLQATIPGTYQRVQNAFTRYRINYVTRSLTSRFGLVIQDGPFAGMRYVSEAICSNLSPKLLGSYEAELQPTLSIIIRKNYTTVIDIGCAEGYYAVGLALRLPDATVHAFDIDNRARDLCKQMAQANLVADRIRVHGECNHEVLQSLANAHTLIICDCEGCELDLLQPQLVQNLSGCDLLIELHELIVPGVTQELISRFLPTHHIQLIDSQEPDLSKYPGLQYFSRLNKRVAVAEFRDGPMQWAWMRCKGLAG